MRRTLFSTPAPFLFRRRNPMNDVVSTTTAPQPGDSAPQQERQTSSHSLKRPLRVLDIWALGVGVVITGEYFGWNSALKNNGPVAVLIASLIVCVLYLV